MKEIRASVDHKTIREELTDFTQKLVVAVPAPDEMVHAIVAAIPAAPGSSATG
jgi:hypothetical protein